MNTFFSKNLQYMYLQKKYYGHVFLMPPEQYVEYLRRVYLKFKNSNGPKTLQELKRLALEEAKKASTTMNVKEGKNEDNENFLLKEDVIKLLKSVYDIVSPLLLKMSHNYKNERRKVYEDNAQYFEVIKRFELQKVKLLSYTIKSIGKVMKIKYKTLQSSVFYYLEKKDKEIYDLINSFSNVGKSFALAPKYLNLEGVIEILKTYYENLKYLITSSEKSEILNYSLIIMNDLVYENFGLEEEQVYAAINEKKLNETNKEVNLYLNLIKNLILDNVFSLFDI
jgi:hypothetical protein